jgi:hypothetical protein
MHNFIKQLNKLVNVHNTFSLIINHMGHRKRPLPWSVKAAALESNIDRDGFNIWQNLIL